MEAMNNLNLILESLLFTAGRPIKAKDLAKILEVDITIVQNTLDSMVEEKRNLGIVLLKSGEGYQLSTNSIFAPYVKNFLNAELREKLTDATVEVLAIIAYRQPISKAEIEAIRGVNSQYSVRNLLVRGLIEKVANIGDARSVYYQTTTEFLMHMGITSVKDLPEFDKLTENIKLPQTTGLTQNTETKEAPATTIQEESKIEPKTQELIPESTTKPEAVIEEENEQDDESEDMDDDEDEEE